MTDSERLWTGIALSLFLHFGIVISHGPDPEEHKPFRAILEMDGQSVLVQEAVQTGTGLQQASPHDREEAEKLDQKRRAYLRYLDDVDDAIHARRFSGDTSLIGFAICSFTINSDGTFSDASVIRTSGDPRLDASALHAVHSASGVVKRPAIIGPDPIHVSLQVKYQYSL
ncbi:MAG: TonB family protein [Mailhella sp.]|nr:TonB family protein [Mailhella sp.]